MALAPVLTKGQRNGCLQVAKKKKKAVTFEEKTKLNEGTRAGGSTGDYLEELKNNKKALDIGAMDPEQRVDYLQKRLDAANEDVVNTRSRLPDKYKDLPLDDIYKDLDDYQSKLDGLQAKVDERAAQTNADIKDWKRTQRIGNVFLDTITDPEFRSMDRAALVRASDAAGLEGKEAQGFRAKLAKTAKMSDEDFAAVKSSSEDSLARVNDNLEKLNDNLEKLRPSTGVWTEGVWTEAELRSAEPKERKALVGTLKRRPQTTKGYLSSLKGRIRRLQNLEAAAAEADEELAGAKRDLSLSQSIAQDGSDGPGRKTAAFVVGGLIIGGGVATAVVYLTPSGSPSPTPSGSQSPSSRSPSSRLKSPPSD